MAEPSAKDRTAIDAAKTETEAEATLERKRAEEKAPAGNTPRTSGDSPKPHGDPLRPVIEE